MIIHLLYNVIQLLLYLDQALYLSIHLITKTRTNKNIEKKIILFIDWPYNTSTYTSSRIKRCIEAFLYFTLFFYTKLYYNNNLQRDYKVNCRFHEGNKQNPSLTYSIILSISTIIPMCYTKEWSDLFHDFSTKTIHRIKHDNSFCFHE